MYLLLRAESMPRRCDSIMASMSDVLGGRASEDVDDDREPLYASRTEMLDDDAALAKWGCLEWYAGGNWRLVHNLLTLEEDVDRSEKTERLRLSEAQDRRITGLFLGCAGRLEEAADKLLKHVTAKLGCS
jgi:hypothetical protein